MDRRVKAIVKLINVLYKPLGIEINDIDDNGFPQTLINIYFSEIDDSYISNPHHRDVKYLKERNFEFKLRKHYSLCCSIKRKPTLFNPT